MEDLATQQPLEQGEHRQTSVPEEGPHETHF